MSSVNINGLPPSQLDGLILFSDVPNIVTYENSDQGEKAFFMITVGTNQYQSLPSGQTITINGETITSVNDISKVGGRYFYLGVNSSWVMPTIVDALRNCPNLAASYDICAYSSDAGDIDQPYALIVKAKQNGTKYNLTTSSTINNSHILLFENYIGKSNDELLNTDFAKVQLQIYKYTDFDRYLNVDTYGDVLNDEEYVTTLVKTYYQDEVKFDISPVLATFAEYGRLVYFRLIITVFTSSNELSYRQIRSIHNLYCTVGYRCNHSVPFIPQVNTPCLMQNVGNGIEWANMHTLYVWKPSLVFSWVSSTQNSNFTIKYLDSTFNQRYSTVVSTSNNGGIDKKFDLNPSYLEECSYVSVQLPNNRGNLLYTIIKGINAADECTRLQWRNEYGGISFFDFTGKHNEQMKLNTETYEKSDLDYYDNGNDVEKDVVYSRDVEHKFTVTSHLIDKNGTQIFESLAKSKKVWFLDEQTNEKVNVIIEDISINESADFFDVYTVSVTYHLSREN